MKTGFTIQYLEQQLAAGKIRGYQVNNPPAKLPVQQPANKRSKYGNEKFEVDGIEFDSIKEGKRYNELKLLLKAGVIGLLDLQVPFELNPGGTHSLKYIADFVYVIAATGERVVEDAKGHRTKEYLKKRRLMKKVHNIKIKEV